MTVAVHVATVAGAVAESVQAASADSSVEVRSSSEAPRYRSTPTTKSEAWMSTSAPCFSVNVTAAFFGVVVPTATVLPPLILVLEKVTSRAYGPPSVAWAAGTARAPRARAPVAATAVARMRMRSPREEKGVRKGDARGPAAGRTPGGERPAQRTSTKSPAALTAGVLVVPAKEKR